MPPASKKDCSVILFDIAAQSAAKQTLLKICCNNFFSNSKDLTKLILINTAETENRLNAKYDGYNHINEVAKDVTVYDPRLLLEQIDENSETAEANWLEGLFVALKNLEEEFENIGGIITHQILFITDLVTPLTKADDKLIDKIVKGLKNLDAFLYVIGPEIEAPFTIKNQKHVKTWMKNLKVDAGNENLTVLKTIISKTDNSVICDYKMAVHLFFSYRNWGGTQPWQVPLAIGSKIQMPAQTMKILNEDIPLKLVSTQGTIRQPTWISAQDETKEIDGTEVINGITRHEKFVQMPDNKMFQVQNLRGFSVLCFTDSICVPEYYMRGEGCYCVLPNSTPEKNEALHILIDCLAKQKKYVIARRVYNNNYVPKIVVLVPKPDHNPKCFFLTGLPFAEDVCVNYRERKIESAPKVDTSEEVYDFLDSLNIDSDNSNRRFPLGIKMMQNSNIQKIINKGIDKLLDQHFMLEEVDVDLLEPPTGKIFEAVKSIWTPRTLKEVREERSGDGEESGDDDFEW